MTAATGGDVGTATNTERASVQNIAARVTELFEQVAANLTGHNGVEIKKDNEYPSYPTLAHNANAFFDIGDGRYFHLRGHVNMMQWREITPEKVILSGYLREAPNLTGAGNQVFKTGHYSADPSMIAINIKEQNPTLFL